MGGSLLLGCSGSSSICPRHIKTLHGSMCMNSVLVHAEGFGCEVICTAQSLSQRPGWAANAVVQFLKGGTPYLESIFVFSQICEKYVALQQHH